MRKIIGYISAAIAVGLLFFILINVAYYAINYQHILKTNLIHWIGELAIFCSIIAAWAFWEI